MGRSTFNWVLYDLTSWVPTSENTDSNPSKGIDICFFDVYKTTQLRLIRVSTTENKKSEKWTCHPTFVCWGKDKSWRCYHSVSVDSDKPLLLSMIYWNIYYNLMNSNCFYWIPNVTLAQMPLILWRQLCFSCYDMNEYTHQNTHWTNKYQDLYHRSKICDRYFPEIITRKSTQNMI